MKIVSASFITAAYAREHWPDTSLPEIAFAGRSNVGKSSLINFLLNRHKLVKTSSTPGKTRSINFFLINEKFILTDLPGYGYASGNKKEVASWRPMIEQYLQERQQLRGLIHIVDIRRTPDELEQMMANWSREASYDHILIGSKADKLSRNRCMQSSAAIKKILGKAPILSSALNGTGKKEVWQKIRPLIETT